MQINWINRIKSAQKLKQRNWFSVCGVLLFSPHKLIWLKVSMWETWKFLLVPIHLALQIKSDFGKSREAKKRQRSVLCDLLLEMA